MRPSTDVLATWLPMLVFVAVWLYFMRRNPWFSKQLDYYERSHRHMERVEELLGRIAAALERR